MTAEYVVLRCELAGISIRNSTDAKMFPDSYHRSGYPEIYEAKIGG